MREVVSLVFGIREAKLTIAKDEEGKVDFFLFGMRPSNFNLSDCRVQSETDHRPLRIQRRLPHQSL